MLWLILLVASAGLVSGCTFRVPMLFAGSAVIVVYGLLTSMPWQTWVAGLVIFQASYLASLFVSTVWSRHGRWGARDRM